MIDSNILTWPLSSQSSSHYLPRAPACSWQFLGICSFLTKVCAFLCRDLGFATSRYNGDASSSSSLLLKPKFMLLLRQSKWPHSRTEGNPESSPHAPLSLEAEEYRGGSACRSFFLGCQCPMSTAVVSRSAINFLAPLNSPQDYWAPYPPSPICKCYLLRADISAADCHDLLLKIMLREFHFKISPLNTVNFF